MWIPDPSLSEREAHQLCAGVVERLKALYDTYPTRIGVDLTREGFFFTADLNGRMVTARTGKGTVTYAAVARELWLLSREATDRGLEIESITLPNGVQV